MSGKRPESLAVHIYIKILIKVKGLARVVTRLQDAKSIQPGEILITTSTDIGNTMRK